MASIQRACFNALDCFVFLDAKLIFSTWSGVAYKREPQSMEFGKRDHIYSFVIFFLKSRPEGKWPETDLPWESARATDEDVILGHFDGLDLVVMHMRDRYP